MRVDRLYILSFFLFSSCSSTYQTLTYNEPSRGADSLEIHEGIVCQHAQRINYKRNGIAIAVIELSEPVMVAMADSEEPWGYFQFPNIGKTDDGILIISWQMKEDSHMTYGMSSKRYYTPMMSKDGGKTWLSQDREYNKYVRGYNAKLSDGSFIQVSTPKSKNIKDYKKFPKAVAQKGNQSFFRIDELPDELQGVYMAYRGIDGVTKRIHSKLYDPQLLRSALDDMMPIVWWGNIKEMADKSLVAGVYPTVYVENGNKISHSGVSFYQSNDSGKLWNAISRIPFTCDEIAKTRGGESFDEPAFEILADSTFICVMRTGSTSPMYKTLSYDKGKTWTTPIPFTPNGVLPNLMLLNNNVLVLASGRPGIQIRFDIDGNGMEWTDPIDMIPFMNLDGTYTKDVSCGYTSIIEIGNNSFVMAYSDFTTRNFLGQQRKSIWFRKIEIMRL